MFRRAQPITFAALLLLGPCVAAAQVVWQPTPPPLVTAENTSWYLAGEAVDWNGDLYYQAGPVQFFNRYQMVRSGSFRGIPLYTDGTLQPNSIVFVPLPGERMQPYERLRTGVLAGTTGSRTPSFPPDIGAQSTQPRGLTEAPSAPSQAAAYDVPPATPARAIDAPARRVVQPATVGTSGRLVAAPVAARRPRAAQRPAGSSAIWVDFDGRRWFSAGKAIAYDAAGLTEVGQYHGWSVYTRTGDGSTIYIPASPGRLAPYKTR